MANPVCQLLGGSVQLTAKVLNGWLGFYELWFFRKALTTKKMLENEDGFVLRLGR
jgi:hypothetical protein